MAHDSSKTHLFEQKQVQLELEKTFATYVNEILAARSKAALLHESSDIKASGNEIEDVLRELFCRRLPTRYYVGNGHIVDQTGTCSNQFDMVISDNFNSPILFEASDGTQYFPYESVYLIAEFKTKYYSANRPIHEFVAKIKKLKMRLKREDVDPMYIGPNIKLGSSFKTDDHRKYSNPLCKFMFFLESGDFDLSQVVDLYSSEPIECLPNYICFLDKGMLQYAQVKYDDNRELKTVSVTCVPECAKESEEAPHKWWFLEYGIDSPNAALTLAHCYFATYQSLLTCRLKALNLQPYMNTFSRIYRAGTYNK